MPKTSNPRKTWRYTNEFKAKAVQLTYLDGVQIKKVAETLDIHPFMLSRWRKEYREGKIVADKRHKVTSIRNEKKELDRVKALEKEVARLKQENDLPKKVATVSGGTTSERFGFIQRYGREIGVRYLCQWLGVSRSGYYDWLKRDLSKRAKEEIMLLERIRSIHQVSRQAYGSPRVYRSLKASGITVGKNRVARIMRENGIQGRVVTVTRRAPGLRQFQQDGENLRLQSSFPKAKDKQWVADLTYVKVGSQYQYLITIMDVYSRRILGWSLCQSRTAADVLALLRRVIRKRRPDPGLIFHTDRGIEFMAYTLQEELARHGLKRSYNRLGHCTDNAHMESFYHSLKGELIRGRIFNRKQDLRSALSSYIDGFYNRSRLHSGIGYTNPIEYENRAA
ncbi:MAG: IS3 family transposase [Candidatus Thiodiazotropha lotti]|uniref:IS3 family transposase n=1 Tax=Candidatus Thiodiazotropha lotti TaxID=2792787 RepID=A0A9E4K1I6_9GAMM|nr:IS3 family transposase [Candidatus Thiodiazotropha lotti]MCG8001833.1 IS3 family transposase [Candidatus Thiodiazotropha lotti]MCW4185451.1 IS3 family transposase [Candidatus Thiodiazotropha lotti]MCW4202078.1 IS3 family transposase [Candidatus Thiodiazotropha lotti]